jgi:putative ABC transport system substrate-binding protein
MRRREVITLIGGAAAAPSLLWPLAAHAQQGALPVVGFLSNGSLAPRQYQVEAFRQGLNDGGYTAGQNVAIEYRWADDREDQLPALVADLVRRQVNVIVVSTGTSSALAAKAATTAIPIMFCVGGDPVRNRLVASFNRPGGNVTGVSYLTNAVQPKRLGLLRELKPNAGLMAFLVNPVNPNAAADVAEMQAAARSVGQQISVVNASSERDFDAVFADLIQQRADAVVVASDTTFLNQRDRLIAVAARHRLPAIYDGREFVAAGGLVGYGASRADAFRQAGGYVGRILKGDAPADLPVLLPTKLELVINLATAKVLGIDVPAPLLALADEVIE